MNERFQAETIAHAACLRAILDALTNEQRAAVLVNMAHRMGALQANIEASTATDSFLHAVIEARADWERVIVGSLSDDYLQVLRVAAGRAENPPHPVKSGE